MADDPQVAETPAAEANGSDKEPELKELLAEWDGRVSKSFEAPLEDGEIVLRDPDEIATFESRISSLETDNSALKTDNAGLSERAEQAEGALDFVDENLTRIDQRDYDLLIERLASETGVSKRVAKLELNERLTDPDFVAAGDGRFDDSERFESMVTSMIDDLFDQHPPREHHRQVAAAVRMARTNVAGGGAYDEASYGDWPTMTDQEFARQSEKVFEDMRSGKLRPEGRRPGGGCLKTGPW